MLKQHRQMKVYRDKAMRGHHHASSEATHVSGNNTLRRRAVGGAGAAGALRLELPSEMHALGSIALPDPQWIITGQGRPAELLIGCVARWE
jgi:hypothetical protein